MEAGEEHRRLMAEAVEREAQAQRMLMSGERAASGPAFLGAAQLYRRSWESAPPASYGRLVGMLKAAVLGGEAEQAARYALDALGPHRLDSPTSAYAGAIAALVLEDDAAAAECAQLMPPGGEAFARTARAITALAQRDANGYRAALEEIVRSFEEREVHLTSIPIADTAVMLEAFAERRRLAARPSSVVLPR